MQNAHHTCVEGDPTSGRRGERIAVMETVTDEKRGGYQGHVQGGERVMTKIESQL